MYSAWRDHHGHPVYPPSETCPECDAATENSTSAPYNPESPHGECRRARRHRLAEESE